MNRRRWVVRRRALLATIAAISGCTTAPRASNPTPETGNTPSNGSNQRCPPAPDSETTVRCSDSGTQSSIRMTVSPASLDLPPDSSRFTLHNESEKRLTSSVGAYQLFVRTGGNWEFIVPKGGAGSTQPIELQPGETREWTLHVNTANLGGLTPPESSKDSRSFTFRFLPGTYAFGFRVHPEGSGTAQLYSTTFTVSGDDPRLVPSDRVDTHARRGNTLTVKTQTTKEYDTSRRVSLLMERHSTTQQAAPLGLFELYNPLYERVPSYDSGFVRSHFAELLRDAFSFVNSSDEQIRVQTVDTTRPPLGLGENESLSVRYGGGTWKLTSQIGWE